jgi:hypothetical protein
MNLYLKHIKSITELFYFFEVFPFKMHPEST